MPRRNRTQYAQRPLQARPTGCRQKRPYPTEATVIAAVELASLEKPQTALQYYKCPYGNHWHLTSKSSKHEARNI